MATQTIRVSLCVWILVGILITGGFKREGTEAIAALFKNPRSATDTCLRFFTEYLSKYLCIEHIYSTMMLLKERAKMFISFSSVYLSIEIE
jgi:hypothetical protein